jgi:hypothetical protein
MTEFWVVYDYGMGGAWGLARADSAGDIRSVLPELNVVNARPEWMTDEIEAEVRSHSSFTADDPGTYPEWIRTMITERNR